MKRSRRRPRLGLSELHRAFDEARFGDQRTLNLRESLPTVDDRSARTMLERQLSAAGFEVHSTND